MPRKQKPLMQPVLASLVKHNNQQLFSDYFVDKILPKEEAWQALSSEVEPVMSTLQERFARFATHANESQTERDWIQPVLEALGHTFEVQARLKVPGGSQQPDYVFYVSEEQRFAAREHDLDDSAMQRGAIAIGDAKQWERPLDQMRRGASSDSFSNKNPSFQIFFYMLHSKLPWGILTNGRKWRLYHEATAYKLEVFYEVDLPDLLMSNETEDFLYFYAFFRRAAFDRGHALSLEHILAASTESSQKIRDNLREQVYDALRHVAQGFFDYPQNRLTPTPEIRRMIYENSLILLYRLLFILYAESRDLLPIDENAPYRNRYSLNAIKQQLHKALRNHELLLPNSGVIWAQLKTLFTSINEGNKLLNITTFDGGLFDPENADFLERYTVGDLSLAQAIDKLASTQDLQDLFIDYRDLSERHLGTIYEGLLEYTLHVASEPMAELCSSSTIVPLQEAAKSDIAREYKIGEVYLITDSGRRKTTGSYYTPDYIVKYMVEQTLKPVLDEAVQGKISDEERIQAVLAVNVLDPAMGSGHFPVEVVECIARFLVELGVQPEGKAEHEADMTYWKRRVAQQCIYGVDTNRLAVELAKLSLWLATAAKGYPLNFLDHHLRPGNALIGVWLEDVATGEHPKVKLARLRGELAPELEIVENAEEAVQSSMLEDEEFSENLSSALDLMKSIEVTPGNTINEVKQQEAAYAELRAHFVDKYERLMHLGTAQFYDIDVEPRLWSAMAEYAVLATNRPEASPFSEHYLQLLSQAYALGLSRGFFHWELEFPAIFFNPDGTPRGEQAGFDVVIGNPPYVRQERLWEDKPFFQDHYEIYHGTADLFVYFFAQGLRLLRPGGRLAYISSNSWLRANYATALRRYLRTQTTVEQIIDLGNTRIFADAPDLSPAIQIVRRLLPSDGNQARVAIFARSDRMAEFRELLNAGRFMEVSIHNQPDSGWQLKSDVSRQLFTRLVAQGKPLGEMVEGQMYRGVLTGLNAAFIIDQATRDQLVKVDAASAQLIKPLVRGEDLRPWYQEDEGLWLIFTRRGINIDSYPAIKEYLQQFREQLEPRPPHLSNNTPWAGRKPGKYKWYEIQDTVEYYQEFEHSKIFFPDITKRVFEWGCSGKSRSEVREHASACREFDESL